MEPISWRRKKGSEAMTLPRHRRLRRLEQTKTLYGGDQWTGREAALLDPQHDAAKIRAFFIHPSWARRGIGTMILEACENAAVAAGFTRFEMGATLTGVPLYQARGYVALENLEVPLANGESLPIVRMEKRMAESAAGLKKPDERAAASSRRRALSGVFTCSGRNPSPSTRAGIRCSNGQRPSSFTGHGGESGLVLLNTLSDTLFCTISCMRWVARVGNVLRRCTACKSL